MVIGFIILTLLGICAIAAVVMVVGYIVDSISDWLYWRRHTWTEFPWWEF